jgi:hypothetical protein
MIRPSALLLPSALVLALAQGPACRWPEPSPPVVFHTLTPLQPAAAPAAPSGIKVEVLPVRLPEILLRPQMVLAQGSGTLRLSETHRWGNPLDRDMQRVLAQDLAVLLGSDAVVASPYGDRAGAAFRVQVDVQSCDGRDGQGLAMKAVWMVTRADGGPALVVRRTMLREPLPSADPGALADAHSRILADLAREIAEGLRSCTKGE